MSNGFSVVIVGAGIAGLAAAIALAKNGNTVTVLEAAPKVSHCPSRTHTRILACKLTSTDGTIPSSPRLEPASSFPPIPFALQDNLVYTTQSSGVRLGPRQSC